MNTYKLTLSTNVTAESLKEAVQIFLNLVSQESQTVWLSYSYERTLSGGYKLNLRDSVKYYDV